MSSPTLKEKIDQLVASYRTSQKEQEARHMTFMAEAMRILESRTKDLEILREDKQQLESKLAQALQEIKELKTKLACSLTVANLQGECK